MGMFDTVHVNCPRCGEIVEFQSKAGECELNTYTDDNTPHDIAHSIIGNVSECESCGYSVKIKGIKPIKKYHIEIE